MKMTPTLHFCRATMRAILLLVLPIVTTVSAWAVPRLFIPRQIGSETNSNAVRKMGRATPSQSPPRAQLTVLAMDPADAAVAAALHYDHAYASSALDALSSLTIAKATAAISSTT